MKAVTRWIPILATGSLLAAACERTSDDISAPQATPAFSNAAERIVEEYLYDMTDTHFAFSCSAEGELLPETEGELVRLEGQIYERITRLFDAAGGGHFTFNSMPVGLRGTGVTSGEEFRVSESNQAVANNRLAGLNGAYRQTQKMVGKDTGHTFWLVSSGHYLISADGEIKLTRDAQRVECKVRG